MEFSAQMIADLVAGTIVGDPQVKVNDFAKIEEGRPGCISFLYNDKYENHLYLQHYMIYHFHLIYLILNYYNYLLLV